MTTRADWDTLPYDVASKILWSDRLQLHDKLRCQQVSKRWKNLMDQVLSKPEHGILAEELLVEFVHPESIPETKHTALQLNNGLKILIAVDEDSQS